MAVVYRSEKKKILHTNIDLCGYIIGIIEWLKSRNGKVTLEEYRERCLEKTEIERQPGLVKRWVYNGDAVFSEEEQYFRRRLCLRGYLKDIAELVGISSETPASSPVIKSEESEYPLTVFDRIVRKEIPANIIYEDELAVAFKDSFPVAPVHFLVVPRNKQGLTSLNKAESKHANLLGHLMIVAAKVAK